MLGGAARAEPVTITLLHTNDVYEIAPREGRGGLAELATLLQQERANAAHSITTFGGDLISPSVLSGLTQGAQMIELYNLLGTDVAVLGNHEFDFGPDGRRAAHRGIRLPLARHQRARPPTASRRSARSICTWWTSAATGSASSGCSRPKPTCCPRPARTSPSRRPSRPPEPRSQRLEAAGADVIVALTHDDLADDRDLARQVEAIDLILGGHDHDPMTFDDGGTLIVKAGHDAHYLAAVDLAVERVQRGGEAAVEVVPTAWRYISTAGVEPDPEVQAVVARYEEQLDQEFALPVGTTTVMLDSRRSTVRTGESNFGNLITDVMRQAVGAEVALMNAGGIRGDRTYQPGTVLTRNDVLTELPFGNVVVLIGLSGADLLAALENGVSEIEDDAGRFAQVSGMSYAYDPKRPPGSRIVEVEVGGDPLDVGRTYRVAANDYMFRGGDGYEALARGEVVIDPSGGHAAREHGDGPHQAAGRDRAPGRRPDHAGGLTRAL